MDGLWAVHPGCPPTVHAYPWCSGDCVIDWGIKYLQSFDLVKVFKVGYWNPDHGRIQRSPVHGVSRLRPLVLENYSRHANVPPPVKAAPISWDQEVSPAMRNCARSIKHQQKVHGKEQTNNEPNNEPVTLNIKDENLKEKLRSEQELRDAKSALKKYGRIMFLEIFWQMIIISHLF
ncbi:hypothetical protein DFH28DRAFT_1106928 [Melampsora americana]|nr:hypothetical protein DFH28DRAFT_1106928 [Melampsora americana]